jgi:hypothetical protein
MSEDEDENPSDLSMSSPEDSEFSEWSGFSDGDLTGDEHESNHQLSKDEGENNSPLSQHETQESESEDEIDKHEAAQRRARDFKLWAREQSGLGTSISNIDSLPALLPGQREAAACVLDRQDNPPPVFDHKTNRQHVFYNLNSMLTVVIFCPGK